MCGSCGCGDESGAHAHAIHGPGAQAPALHEPGRQGPARHVHEEGHGHLRDHGHDPAAPAGAHAHHHADAHAAQARRIAVEGSILAENRAQADALRARLAARGIEAIGLLGAPGSGKTALLEATFRALLAEAGPQALRREAVIEGDCATDRDARRVAALGARVAQIETGALCHLDAHLVEHALETLPLDGVRRLWIENVGNLVCPAPFACGETRRVALVSTPEGDDKPEKYPALFAAVDLLLVTKADLLPHLDFDPDRCIAAARRVQPGLPALVLSAQSGAGLPAWLSWLREGQA